MEISTFVLQAFWRAQRSGYERSSWLSSERSSQRTTVEIILKTIYMFTKKWICSVSSVVKSGRARLRPIRVRLIRLRQKTSHQIFFNLGKNPLSRGGQKQYSPCWCEGVAFTQTRLTPTFGPSAGLPTKHRRPSEGRLKVLRWVLRSLVLRSLVLRVLAFGSLGFRSLGF